MRLFLIGAIVAILAMLLLQSYSENKLPTACEKLQNACYSQCELYAEKCKVGASNEPTKRTDIF
jgi:hypothetical protein